MNKYNARLFINAIVKQNNIELKDYQLILLYRILTTPTPKFIMERRPLMDNYKQVRFDIYCKKCIYKDLEEYKDPCNECLMYGARIGTEKPMCWKEKNNGN